MIAGLQRAKVFLNRFRGGPEIRLATGDDLPQCIRMALDMAREEGKQTDPGLSRRLADHFIQVATGPDSVLFVANGDETIQGMIACIVSPDIDIWSADLSASIYLHYVKPKFRSRPKVDLSLLRTAIEYAEQAGAKRIIASARGPADSGMAKRMRDVLGFELEQTHYVFRSKGD